LPLLVKEYHLLTTKELIEDIEPKIRELKQTIAEFGILNKIAVSFKPKQRSARAVF